MVYRPIERVRFGRMTAATIGFLSASGLLCPSQAQCRGREFHVDFRRAEFGFICNALSVRHIARRPGSEWDALRGIVPLHPVFSAYPGIIWDLLWVAL
jgi:hypothetical protein